MWKIYKKDESERLEKLLNTFIGNKNLTIRNDTDIIETCRSLGFKILMMPLSKRRLDGIILVEDKDMFIGVNMELPVQKARFVIAHELGHYIDQSDKLKDNSKLLFFAAKDRIYHDQEKPDTEHDMDYLAASILVPKEQFMKELSSFEVDIASFKDLTKEEIEEKADKDLLEYFAGRYNVEAEVIIKRIAEVSYYA